MEWLYTFGDFTGAGACIFVPGMMNNERSEDISDSKEKSKTTESEKMGCAKNQDLKIRELQEQISELREEKDAAQQDAKTLHHENNKLRESSNELTKKMAKLTGSDPRFVNVNDDTSPVQLGRLSDNIYANDWFKAYESLYKTEENEFKILESLSNIMQKCYKRCQSKSEETLRQFLLLEQEENLPSDEEAKQLLQLRRSLYHKKDRRVHIVKEITQLIVEELEDITINADTPNDPLLQYVSRCTELCWLVVTSFPPLYLEFDVEDKQFKDIQSQFQLYSSGSPVICDSEDAIDKVASVIWPALVTYDRTDVYTKGDVLVYNKTETAM